MNSSPHKHHTSPGLVLAAFATVYIVWGSTYFGIRYAVESIPPFLMGGSRFFVAGAVLFTWSQRKGFSWPTGRQWRDATIVGCLMLLGGNGGVTWAEQTVPSSVTALIVAIAPLWMVLLEWREPGGRRPTLRVFAGLLVGFIGVAYLVLAGHGYDGGALNPWGIAAILFATVTWAAGSVFSRCATKPKSALTSTGMQMIAGGGVMMIVGFALGEGPQFSFSTVTAVSAWAWVYLALFGSLIGFTAYLWLLQVSTPSKVSTTSFVNPLIAVVLGCTLGGEPFTPKLLLSGAMILVAVILILRSAKPRKQSTRTVSILKAEEEPVG